MKKVVLGLLIIFLGLVSLNVGYTEEFVWTKRRSGIGYNDGLSFRYWLSAKIGTELSVFYESNRYIDTQYAK